MEKGAANETKPITEQDTEPQEEPVAELAPQPVAHVGKTAKDEPAAGTAVETDPEFL